MSFLDDLPATPTRPAVDLDRAAGHEPSALCKAEYARLAERYSINPHGLTNYAEECRRALRLAARRILELVGSDESEAGVVWCANGTEAANLAIAGFPYPQGGGVIAVDAGSHHAVLESARHTGQKVVEFTIDDGGHARGSLPGGATLAALPVVNNENGVIWDGDTSPFPESCHLLLDACQALGKHHVPWRESRAAMAILSGRKLGGPATGACLVYRKEVRLTPLIHGGGQQDGLVSGTVDTVSMLLFTAAAEEACAREKESLARTTALNRMLRDGIRMTTNDKCVFFSPETASPYILYFAIPGYEGALVARLLAKGHGILVGTGSACTAESGETSRLLRSRGVPDGLARGAIRASLAPDSTEEDVRAFLAALPAVLGSY